MLRELCSLKGLIFFTCFLLCFFVIFKTFKQTELTVEKSEHIDKDNSKRHPSFYLEIITVKTDSFKHTDI